MPDLIKVGMADYKVGAAPSTLISYGLGSCIGLSLYDPQTKVGGLLHYMLPDSKQARPSDTPAKFIDTGFPLMLADVLKLGAVKSRLVAKIAGGAQMFAFSNTTSAAMTEKTSAMPSLNIFSPSPLGKYRYIQHRHLDAFFAGAPAKKLHQSEVLFYQRFPRSSYLPC